MRVGLLTTIDHNIGDDLIRRGLQGALRAACSGQSVEFELVNKHHPASVYPPSHPICWGQYSPLFKRKITAFLGAALYRFGGSKFDGCDAIVQCGTPVYWRQCHRVEWADTIWHQVIGRLSASIPVLNLAAGSCYPWKQQPEHFESQADADYVRRISSYARVTTVRDALAQRLVATVTEQPELIPCSAFLATGIQDLVSDDGIVLVNYMEGGGHYGKKGGKKDVYEQRIKTLIERLASRHRLAFVCHDEKEEFLAKKLDSSLLRIRPGDAATYAASLGPVKAGVCNRMHAAVALAGMGVPCVAIGTDTRLLMVENLGLPIRYVNEVNDKELEDTLEDLIRRRRSERERLAVLRDTTQTRYVGVFSEVLG